MSMLYDNIGNWIYMKVMPILFSICDNKLSGSIVWGDWQVEKLVVMEMDDNQSPWYYVDTSSPEWNTQQ